MPIKNIVLKQIILLLLITLLGIVLICQLRYFIPGILGAITLYILLRQSFFRLTLIYKWKKWLAAIFLILAFVVVLVLPIWGIVELLMPKFRYVFANSNAFIENGKQLVAHLKEHIPWINIDNGQIQNGVQQAMKMVPSFLNAASSVLVNILVAIFILYFMFISGREMERSIIKFLPLKEENTDSLWSETRNMVVSNAVGIPVLMLCQAAIATLGYWLFGVKEPLLWGVLTGVASLIPVVGTMIVWIPIAILMMANDRVGMGIGLLLYCGVIVANIDNVLRFTILKRIGNVHPLITVFGVIVGLQIFGLMGLIFGPLLISYFILLVKIYRLEFAKEAV